MAEYLVKDESLVAVADAIRVKTGGTEPLTLDQMVTEIEGISTGVELNFNVVGGTSAPSNPTENTIWVNTDTEITSWIFSSTAPETPEEGMVWVFTAAESPAEFNALKKNTIRIYPVSAKQYVSGSFVVVQAVIYKDGVWTSWITKVYDTGNEFADFTGGINITTGRSGDYNTSYNAQKYADHIYLYTTRTSSEAHNSWASLYTAKKLDLSPFSTLAVKLTTCTNVLRIAVCDSVPNSYLPSSISELAVGSAGTHKMSIEGIESGYICVLNFTYQYGVGSCTADVSYIELS